MFDISEVYKSTYVTGRIEFIMKDTSLSADRIMFMLSAHLDEARKNSFVDVDLSSFRLVTLYKNYVAIQIPSLPLSVFKYIANSIYKFISVHGDTNRFTNFPIQIDLRKSTLNNGSSFSLNKNLLLYAFDETLAYDSFPHREYSSEVISNRVRSYTEIGLCPNNIKMVNGVPYGLQYDDNERILTINYIGGKGYHENYSNTHEFLDVVVMFVYKSIYGGISDVYTNGFKQIDDKMRILRSAVSSYTNFKDYCPKCKFSVDLKVGSIMLEQYWPQIKPLLWELINPAVESSNYRETIFDMFNEAHINYDTSIGQAQIKNCKRIDKCYIKNRTLSGCEITNSILDNCCLIGTSVRGSIIKNCSVVKSNNIEYSTIVQGEISSSNVVDKCRLNGVESCKTPASNSLMIDCYSTIKGDDTLMLKTRAFQNA